MMNTHVPEPNARHWKNLESISKLLIHLEKAVVEVKEEGLKL